MRKYLLTVIILLLLTLNISLAQQGCFTIVVGKDASADGCVLIVHNEDDGPPQIVNHRKISRQKHEKGEMIKLIKGGEVEQAAETWSCIWSEMPGMIFSDSYVNEWGVCVTSNNCPSREDNPELTDGGISYMLRRIVAQRAKTAKEGVRIAGELVEKFGYDAPGRTLVICDPNEGWFMCLINGKRWIAQRVPDDKAAMVANTYNVHNFHISDNNNFMGSPDIIDYAVERGWYKPEENKSFDFAAVYANPQAASSPDNIYRLWNGLNKIVEKPFKSGQPLPFAVTPKHKLNVSDLMDIVRDHYEGTEYYEADAKSGNPHEKGVSAICNSTTMTSFIAQLRGGMPSDIGIVYWVCLGSPCSSIYLPFHFGIDHFPEGYDTGGTMPDIQTYLSKVESPFKADRAEAFYTFMNFSHKAGRRYAVLHKNASMEISDFEKRIINAQKSLDETAVKLYKTNTKTVRTMLTGYSEGVYLESLNNLEMILGH